MQTQLHSLLDSGFEQTDHIPRTRRGGRKYQLRKLFRELYRQGAINRLRLGVDRAPKPGSPTSYLPWRLVPSTFAASFSLIDIVRLSLDHPRIPRHSWTQAPAGQKRLQKFSVSRRSSSPARNSSRDDNPGQNPVF